MRVLNICVDDYANFMHDNAKALRSVGINCHDYKMVKHPFGYETESEIKSEYEISLIIKQFDLIQIFHSDDRFIGFCKGKRTVVYHTGTKYRQNPNGYNAVFNPNVEMCFVALPEFVGLGAKNEQYIVGAVDTDKLIQITLPYFIKRREIRLNISNMKPIVAHYPSNTEVKGTAVINKVIEELLEDGLEFEYLHSTNLVTYPEQLKRMAECDIYIELFAPMQGDKKYGSFGITGLEAGAMRKCVITMGNNDVYKKAYNEDSQLFLIDGVDELKSKIKALVNNYKKHYIYFMLSNYFIFEQIKKNHSYEATGNFIKNKLGI